MSKHPVVKGAVPALAYAQPSEIEEPWLQGALSFKYSSLHNTISLLFAISISVPGSDKEQNFVLVYDADNLVTWKTTLVLDASACDPVWLEKIARDDVSRMHTLSLTLRSACPVWYPRGEVRLPAVSYPTACQQLVEIAKAHQVHLIVDFSWLQKSFESCIRRLVSNTTGLSGFPVAETLGKRYEQGDWTIFQPLEVTNDDPPAYIETSNKRPRRGKWSAPTAFLSTLLTSRCSDHSNFLVAAIQACHTRSRRTQICARITDRGRHFTILRYHH